MQKTRRKGKLKMLLMNCVEFKNNTFYDFLNPKQIHGGCHSTVYKCIIQYVYCMQSFATGYR